MRTTVDRAGRVVIPRALRERVGLTFGGEVELELDGAGIRIEPIAGVGVIEEQGRLVIPATGLSLGDATIRALRDADHR